MKTLHLPKCGFAVLLTVVVAAGVAAQESGAPKKIATVEGITEYQLDNGLRVLLFPDDSRPTVTINLTVFVGSRHEGYGETGMAHLLEHMVFKGTPMHPNVPKALKERGANYNGTTWVDRTNYFETLPASDDNLEFGIRFEADRLVNSFVRRDDLVSEMTVVRNEFEMGENSPFRVLNQRMMAVAYEWHNYGKSTIGNRSDIERVPIDNLQAFYKKHYQPDNAMLVVAGKFDLKKALQFTQKYFGAIPKPKRQLDKTYTEEPPQDGERLVTLRRVGDVGLTGVMYHIPAGPHPDFAAISVLNNILTSEPSGRLYKALVESKKATSIYGSAFAWHDPGMFGFGAEVRKGGDTPSESSSDSGEGRVGVARDTMLAVVEAVGSKGVTAEELLRAKTQILKQRELAAADTSRLAVQLSEWAAQGDWRLYFIHRDRVEKVTADDVKAVAAKYLTRNNRTVGTFFPTEKAERVAIPSTPDVKELVASYKGRDAIAAGEAFDVAPLNIEARTRRWELPEGIKVALLPKKTRGETVQVRLTLRYGNADNLKELVTAAEALPRLMVRGTKKLTHQQLQDELDKQGARLMAFGGPGMASFGFQTKRENLPAVLEILRQVLREPALPAEEFEVLKRERLAQIEAIRNEPQAQAGTYIQRQLSPYPKDDVRYVPTTEEQIQRLQAVTLEQVKEVYRDYLGAQAGELTVVGDFDPAELTQVLSKTLAGWKAAKPYARIERTARSDIAGGKHTINTPDKANAVYVAGLVLPIRDDDADYPALVMANYILGGGTLSSRLGDRIRQKEGLSYGVRSSFNANGLDPRAIFTISAICNPQNIGKVETAVREELELLIRDGVTEDELARAKQAYLQQEQVGRTSDRSLVGALGELLYEKRTMKFQADFEKKIEALTPAEVTNAFRKHISPKKLVIATAGDFDKKGAGGN